MKTEKIERWVDKHTLEAMLENGNFYGTFLEKNNSGCNYKVTLEIEMPEREGTFTESEMEKFCDVLVANCSDSFEKYGAFPRQKYIDKLFNGDFKE
jgi:uncharacterized protein involved in high-affinity Fe2+ transport